MPHFQLRAEEEVADRNQDVMLVDDVCMRCQSTTLRTHRRYALNNTICVACQEEIAVWLARKR